MPDAFSLEADRCAVTSEVSLREEIDRHTGNAHATMRILSSIKRFGSDPSILRFEMTPLPPARMAPLAGSMSWTVRAVRPEPPQPEIEPEAAIEGV